MYSILGYREDNDLGQIDAAHPLAKFQAILVTGHATPRTSRRVQGYTMFDRAPIAISYKPKNPDYLPLVVSSIRQYLPDWPIVIQAEAKDLPPQIWLERNHIEPIIRAAHPKDANKVNRLWDHQRVFAEHYDRWIWWHDDMYLLHDLPSPEATLSEPRVRRLEQNRPNKKLHVWHGWLWDTLAFFQCQSIAAPNPVLHVPRLIERESLNSIPANWDRSRLLFEPTYLLWHWHNHNLQPFEDSVFRCAVFKGTIPDVFSLQAAGHTILTWGKKIDHEGSMKLLAGDQTKSFEC